jgi:hypothetical protein
MGVGPIELVIVGVVLVMLFGPALFAFWLGYTMGKKRRPGEAPGAPFDSQSRPTSPYSPAPPIEPPTDEESPRGGEPKE